MHKSNTARVGNLDSNNSS